MIKTVLFDLDGTLLPMDADVFTKAYFSALSKKLAPRGYEPKSVVKSVLAGVEAMLRNDGSKTNEQAFWSVFADIFGQSSLGDRPIFDDFYRNEFNGVKDVCGFDPDAGRAVGELKSRGYRLVLASNPIFPVEAHINRLRWAGVDETSFEYITSYSNSHYCKPNPAYYTEIAQAIGCAPQDCIMIGNDISDDMSAQKAGMKVFLLPACLINTTDKHVQDFPNGSLAELVEYVAGVQ